ncbi:MAG: amidohydrolase [Planctomycetia bacterium]|nr:amidohydrolase [Planctomycetia bacterium]
MSRLLLVNARIRTFDANVPEQAALIAENGKISYVGDDFTVRSSYRDGDEIYDLEGRSVFPAFHDAHTHFYHYALTLRRLRLDDSHSEHAACQGVRGTADRSQPGEWIVGRGWSLARWGNDAPWPTKASLDEAAPNNPVALSSKDGHTWWVSSKALAAAGITKATKNPAGGVIERDAAGEPTGILRETALELVKPFIASPPAQAVRGGLLDATLQFHTLGIASADIVAGSMGRDIELEEGFRLLQTLARTGGLALRLNVYFPAHDLDRLIACSFRSGFGSDWLRFGGIKLYADGSLGSRTAAMLKPYEGGTDTGVEVLPAAEMAQIVKKAAENGIACAIHAIGDKAVRNALDAFAAAKPAADAFRLRQRLEHAQIVDPADIPRFKQLGVVASMQPCQIMGDIEPAERLWGEERAKRIFPVRSLMASGAVVAFGTDVPVEPPDPRRSLKGAVLRPREDGSIFNEAECIGPWDAFLAYTRGSAWAAGVEDRAGRLVPGCRADMAVWSEDPIEIPVKRMADAAVVMTVIDGKVVFRKK